MKTIIVAVITGVCLYFSIGLLGDVYIRVHTIDAADAQKSTTNYSQDSQKPDEMLGDVEMITFSARDKLPYSIKRKCSSFDLTPCQKFDVHLSESVDWLPKYKGLIKFFGKRKLGDHVTLHIANYGGYIWTGAALFNAIDRSNAHVKVVVGAPSYSMGAMLSCSGDELDLQPYSFLMFHTYRGSANGNGAEIRTKALAMDRLAKKIFATCVEKGVLSNKQVTDILNGKDTYIFPADINSQEFVAADDELSSADIH